MEKKPCVSAEETGAEVKTLDTKKKVCVISDDLNVFYFLVVFFYWENAVAEVPDANIVCSPGPEALPHMKKLEWAHSTNAGVEPYVKSGVFDSGKVILTNSAGAYGLAIAEHVVMTALMLLRRMPEYEKIIEDREWEQRLPIRSIYGSKVAIAGAGGVGSEVAHNLGDIDILVMCLPGTPETKGFLNEERIHRLPDTAYVINVGRGATVDQDALIDALNEGRLAGAALDVVFPEPLPKDHPLWNAKNCIITPHSSGDTGLPYSVDCTFDIFCENIKKYANGEELVNRVDVGKGY